MKKYLLSIIILTILFSCEKEIIESRQSATLSLEKDTIIFDTTFNSISTPTQYFTVYNRNNFTIYTDITLNLVDGGSFRMNVDGVPGSHHSSVEIPSNDSIFILLEVTPNNNPNNVFLLTSNILFKTGNTEQTVQLVAPARNAIFYLPQDNIFTNGIDSLNFRYFSIKEDQIWTNELPHVIYGQVVVEPNATLTIQEGTEIYFHNNSGLYIGTPILKDENGNPPDNNGTLIINGTLGNEVILKGDRLDSWYENLPGQWNGIHFVPGSFNNKINYAIIKNGTTAIRADSCIKNGYPTVEINNTIIQNMSSIGILGQGADINALNTIVSKCGQYTVACNIGGSYNFTHCTFANYWDYSNRSTPSILLNNYYEDINGNIQARPLDLANFINCIIYGSLSTEISFQEQDFYPSEEYNFNYNFDHCLIKIDPNTNTGIDNYTNTIINQDPKFIDPSYYNFQLGENSPAINAGKNEVNLDDIEGISRINPDIGAYEFIE